MERGTLYTSPKKIVEKMGIKEGDVLIAYIRDGELVLRHVERRLKVPKPRSKIRAEDVEEVGEEITGEILN